MSHLHRLLDSRYALAVVLALALVLRLGAVLALGDRALEYEFATLTQNLLAGRGYVYYSEAPGGQIVEAALPHPVQTFPSAYMPVGYPLFLWAATSVLGTGPGAMVAVEVVQAVLGMLACLLLYAIGLHLFDRTTALLAALGFAVFPLLVFMAAQISSVGLCVVLFLLFVWLVVRAWASGRALDAMWAGLAFGANALVRSEFVLYLPAVWLWLWWARGVRPLRQAAVITACTAAVLVPWAWRNAVVLGVPTPMTTNSGLNLWVGYGPQASGTHSAYAVPPQALVPELEAALDAVPRTDTYEVERDRVYRDFALRAVRADPARDLRLVLRKLWLFWGHFGGSDIDYPGAESPAFWGPWVLLWPFFAAGLWRSVREAPRRHGFLYLYLLGQTALAAAFFVLPRYRAFVLPVMLLFAASAVAGLLERAATPKPAVLPAVPSPS